MMPFNYHSRRAKMARFAKFITPTVRLATMILAGALVLIGLYWLFVGFSMGWFIMSLAGPVYAFARWVKDALVSIDPGKEQTLDSLLESVILADLTQQITPKILAKASMNSAGAKFFTTRYGLSPQFLFDLSSDSEADSEAVISSAESIRQALARPQISGGMIVASLCLTQPQVKQMLPHLQLDESDLVGGVEWYERLMVIIQNYKRPKKTGGIARDWSFGWANMLNRFGVNVSNQVANSGGSLQLQIDSHANVLQFMHDTFSSSGRQNVALIGPLGSGKTTIVREFAESLLSEDDHRSSQLTYHQIISLDASSIISAAHSRSELEGLVNQLFMEAYKAKNIILCLDDAQLFLEDRPGSVDLGSTLMPIIEGGGIRMILTMDEQRYLEISQRNPSLASLLNRIQVPPASQEDSMLVMQDQIISIEYQRNVTFMFQALREAYRLSERYLYDLVQPGKSVRLLEQAASYHEGGMVTAQSVSKTIEETSGVKVGLTNDASEKEKLLSLETHIHERMINQTRAVSVVSDALRRARAGVRNESRPIGTFLFLGPTGVGKTELSKALAAVYFGGEDRIVRLDLNEYVRTEDVARLIADGAEDPLSLTAQIMKQPFSVVLLDEIEKAHPQVLTTLLQMLDEGILRDINNREVSFRDAIVIATSNAGAERIRQLIDGGHELEEFEEQIVNELIDGGQFRPEFLNRFDEIVVFRPLTQEELAQVVKLIIAGVNKTLEPQKVSVQLSDRATTKLATIGYDPRLGARPMRRVVQRSVENLIAKRLLEGTAQPGDVIEITENDIVTT